MASGYDIKANDNSLFADIKNKHNTMNSSSAEALFQKLKTFADNNKGSNCYWVQILAKKSFNLKWAGIINKKEYSHSRVYKISGDQFYELLTGETDALAQLYKVLPNATDDYLKSIPKSKEIASNSALAEIKEASTKKKRKILDQITFDNYKYYKGFDKL